VARTSFVFEPPSPRKGMRHLASACRPHTAIEFPPQSLKGPVYTYELQRFFKEHAENLILFRGYLEDIEETAKELTVEFTNFSTATAFGQPTIAFRLKTTPAQVEKLLDREPIDPILRFFRRGASDLVVARIEDLKKVRRYEFGGRSHGAHEYDVELDIETPPKFVATGELIDIIQLSGQ